MSKVVDWIDKIIDDHKKIDQNFQSLQKVNSDMDAIIVPVKLLIQGELDKSKGKPFVVKGITPCSVDLFRYRVYLDNPKVGDELVFLNAGAYNFSSDFCDLEKVETDIIN